jgi:hypothetical protein
MTHLPPDEERNLVNFLQQNCPVPPYAKSDEEEQLMELVQRQSHTSQQHKGKRLWIISSAIFAGILLLLSSGSFLLKTDDSSLQASAAKSGSTVLGVLVKPQKPYWAGLKG